MKVDVPIDVKRRHADAPDPRADLIRSAIQS
jgi:hypothetical protein